MVATVLSASRGRFRRGRRLSCASLPNCLAKECRSDTSRRHANSRRNRRDHRDAAPQAPPAHASPGPPYLFFHILRAGCLRSRARDIFSPAKAVVMMFQRARVVVVSRPRSMPFCRSGSGPPTPSGRLSMANFDWCTPGRGAPWSCCPPRCSPLASGAACRRCFPATSTR